ncbi:MAG: hypothetical protein CMK09_07185 [Ponticaulis sp.]|nr:hypothetical protein [Ponticaulis sp.]|tara:strand:- start:19958 stop:20623 length:666 start_codon:yes stop_codon:yes gene_type:complete
MSDAQDRSLSVEHLFSTPLIRARHPELDRLVEPLKAAIYKRKQEHPGVTRSNQGGWHSDGNMRDWAGADAEALIRVAVDAVERHLHNTNPHPNLRMGWNIEIWANVNAAGNANAAHCHPGAFASAVFYVDLGNEGKPAKDGHILLQDPRFPLAFMQQPGILWPGPNEKPVESQFALLPSVGELIVFPSWLMHSVKAHTGSGERISIAINLSMQWQYQESPR